MFLCQSKDTPRCGRIVQAERQCQISSLCLVGQWGNFVLSLRKIILDPKRNRWNWIIYFELCFECHSTFIGTVIVTVQICVFKCSSKSCLYAKYRSYITCCKCGWKTTFVGGTLFGLFLTVNLPVPRRSFSKLLLGLEGVDVVTGRPFVFFL